MSGINMEPDENGWYRPEVFPSKGGMYQTIVRESTGEIRIRHATHYDPWLRAKCNGWLVPAEVLAWREIPEAMFPEWIK